MTFARYFKASSYCTVAAGFLAVAATGSVRASVAVVFAAIFAISGIIDTARFRQKVPAWSLNWLSAACLLFSVADWRLLSKSFLLATIHLLLLFAAIKLLTLTNDRDHLQLYFLSLAQVLASSSLGVNLVYGVALVIFLACSVSTLVLFEMRRSNARMRSTARVLPLVSRRGNLDAGLELFEPFPAGLFLVITIGTAFLILAVAVPLFLILPRVARGPSRQPFGTTQFLSGFSDHVELGRIGTLKLSDAVVMRVKTTKPASETHGDLKWRGLALDYFDGRSWRCTDRHRISIPTQGGYYKLEDSTQGTNWLNQTFFVEALSADVIFAARRTLAVSRDVGALRRDSAENLYRAGRGDRKLRYTVISDLVQPDPSNIADFMPIPEGILKRYLQLPSGDPRVENLAKRVTSAASSRFAKAQALERYLGAKYGYSLILRAIPPGKDPMAVFLFDVKKGHCEYFASAMAVMLRQLGIPARLVNGFRSGEYNPIGSNWIVRQSHAHSWVEAYFPPYGWIEFDPTPPDPVRSRNSIVRVLSNLVDAIDLWWWEGVVNYDSSKQYRLLSALQVGLEGYRDSLADFVGRVYAQYRAGASAVGSAGMPSGTRWRWTHWGLPVLAAAILLACFWRRLPRGRIKRMLYWNRASAAATNFYSEALEMLARRGYKRVRGQTPLEFAASLGDHPSGTCLRALTHLYYEMRFGPPGRAASHAEINIHLNRLLNSLRNR